jgi:hypothetical protein
MSIVVGIGIPSDLFGKLWMGRCLDIVNGALSLVLSRVGFTSIFGAD